MRPRLLDDPWLAPFAPAVRARAERAAARARELAGDAPLAEWATAHERFGLHRVKGGWTFREWAPNATAIWLVGDFSKWERAAAFKLKRGADGEWSGKFPAAAFRHGQFYRLDVKWPGGEGERMPSFARRVVQDPATKLFSAQVWNPPAPYVWKHPFGGDLVEVALPTADGIGAAASAKSGRATSMRSPRATNHAPLIYEAHVGMAQEEAKVGSYAEFRDKILPRVKAAGYDVVQLMGVMEHPYYGSFGYHVSSFFAASSRFGTPEELKSLVDAAHGMGLRVIMDLVHSHAVRNERDGLSLFDGTPWQYFHDGAKGWHRAWDSRCFDYSKREVLRFLLSNCRFWLEEYHFDGYRFDGVTSMLYWDHGLGTNFSGYGDYFNGGVDEDAWAYLALANRVVHETNPRAFTIAEDVSGMPGCAAPAKDCGMGFDFRMAMGVPDFWFRYAEKVRDEDWNVEEIWHELTNRRAEERVVSYVESHDQALVGGKTFFFTLVDAAVYEAMRVDQENLAVARGVALHKMARLATLALSGGAYLNFMGNEFGHPEWIDFPREGNGWSYAHARRQWSLREDANLRFKGLADFDAAMARLVGPCRKSDPVRLAADVPDHVLAFWRDDFVYVFNFDPSRSFTDYGVTVPPGAYRHALDTDETRFGGQGRVERGRTYEPVGVRVGDELVQQVKLYLSARVALVLKRIPPKNFSPQRTQSAQRKK